MPAIAPAGLPFNTDNFMLAFCLRIAGVPLFNPKRPCFNAYDPNILFKIGGGAKDPHGNVTRKSRYSGMTIENAVKAAIADDQMGHVEFQFQRTKNLSKLCKAFFNQEKQINAKGKDIDVAEFMAEIMKKVAAGEMDIAEAIVRVGCVNLKLRGSFMSQWKRVEPLIRIPNPGEVQTRQGTGAVVRRHGVLMKDCGADEYPGYKLLSLNASAQTRERLGV